MPDDLDDRWLRDGLAQLAELAMLDDADAVGPHLVEVEPAGSDHRPRHVGVLIIGALAMAAAVIVALLVVGHRTPATMVADIESRRSSVPVDTTAASGSLLSRAQALQKAHTVTGASLDIGTPSLKRSTTTDLARAGGPPLPIATASGSAPASLPIWVVAAKLIGSPGSNAPTGDTWGVLVLDADSGALLTIVTGGAADHSTWPSYFDALVDQS